jgi:hypothetical protein
MRRDIMAEEVAGRRLCRPRSIPLRSPLVFPSSCCISVLLRYLGTLDLISWELDLGSWRFLFDGFVWGLF